MRRILTGLLAVVCTIGVAGRGGAQAVRQGFVNTPLPLGDDTYRPVDYGFDINYYGVHSNAGEVCSNGYVILNYFAPSQPNCAYPGALSADPSVPNLSGLRDFYASVMAPYFSDVNVTFPGSGQVLVGNGLVDGNFAWAATWDGVAGYAGPGLSTFQLALISLNASGDFRMEFNYNDLAWNGTAIGWTNDDPGVVTSVGVARPSNSRFQCTFIQGSPTACSLATVTPEPATLTLLASGLLGVFGLGAIRRRKGEGA